MSFMASSVQILFVSSTLAENLAWNLGSRKQQRSMIRRWFSEYRASKSSLIASFICLVRAESLPQSSRICVVMWSMTGFRADMVTLFSEARASVKSWRGGKDLADVLHGIYVCTTGHEMPWVPVCSQNRGDSLLTAFQRWSPTWLPHHGSENGYIGL